MEVFFSQWYCVRLCLINSALYDDHDDDSDNDEDVGDEDDHDDDNAALSWMMMNFLSGAKGAKQGATRHCADDGGLLSMTMIWGEVNDDELS